MSAFVDDLLAQVLTLEVSLFACRARMAASTDSEALHDLRIALRKLRSLLRPLREVPALASLEQAAAELGRLSGPWRDLEVLQAELRRRGHAGLIEPSAVANGYRRLLASAELRQLLLLLERWPGLLRRAEADGLLERSNATLRREMRRQRRKLALALADPAHDRHRLRLLIKRVRYTLEAYPRLSPLRADALLALKEGQSALGDWHDRLQWLAQAERQPRLAVLAPRWQRELLLAQDKADSACAVLAGHFPPGK